MSAPPGARRVVVVHGAARLPEGFGKKVLLLDPEGGPPTEVVLCRVQGRLCAVDSLCPHEGGRIADGPLFAGRFVTCPLHLYKFDARSGAPLDVPCDHARTYPVREVGEDAEILL